MTSGEHNRRALRKAAEAMRDGVEPRIENGAGYVPSASRRDVEHRVRVLVHGESVRFVCSCEAGRKRSDDEGVTPCWHTALAAVNCAALDLLVFDGDRWVVTSAGIEHWRTRAA